MERAFSRGAVAFALRAFSDWRDGLRRALVRGTCLLVALSSCASVASAQRYEAADVDDRARLLSGVAQKCVRDPASYSVERERFREYFTKYYFPAMTRFGPDDLAALGDMRYKLFSDFLWRSQNAELQRDLTEMAFEAALRTVYGRDKKNYHPAVRYNAILILGLLDEQYADDRASRPPKPYPKANTELSRVVDLASQGKRVPASILVGALVGLERHARFHQSLDRSSIDAMTAAVVKLASAEESPPDVDSQVGEWIKHQAATILANLGSVGSGNQVHTTMLKLLADGKLSLDVRCQIAALLARLDYEGATIDGKATVEPLLQLAVDVSKAEAKRAKEFEDMHLTGGGFAGGYGGRGGRGGERGGYSSYGYGQPMEFERRILLARLNDLRRGLNATKPLLPDDSQGTVDRIVAAMRPAIDAAQDKDVIDLDLTDRVREMATQIQREAEPGAVGADSEPAGDEFGL